MSTNNNKNAAETAKEVAALLAEGAEETPPAAASPPLLPGGPAEGDPQFTAEPSDLLPPRPPKKKNNAEGAGSAGAPRVAPPTPQKALASMLPPNQRIQVHRRGEDGSLSYIRDYDINDLKGHGTMAAFLQKYLVPLEKIRPGQTEVKYELYLQTSGEAHPRFHSSVQIAVPPGQSASGESTADLIRTIDDLLKAKVNPQPPANPISQMKEVFDLTEKMNESKGDGMMPMLMLMMMQQQKPQTDPAVELLKRELEELRRREERKVFEQALIPAQNLPPPPPAEDKFGALLVEMQKSNTALMQTMFNALSSQNQKPSNEPTFIQQMDFVLRAIKPETPPMGVKDVLELFPKVKELLIPKDDQKDSFEKLMENLKLMKLVREEFIGPSQGQDSGNFWDFAKTLVQSNLGDKIAEGIGADMQAAAVNKTKPKQQQTVDPDAPLEIPQSFAEFAEKIDNAPDIAQRIGATFQGLRHLWGHQGFRPHITKMLDLMKENKKSECIAQLENILGGLVEAEAIKKSSMDEVIQGAKVFWVPICKKMGFGEVTDPEPYTPPAPASQPAPQPATGQQKPPATVTQLKPKPKPVPVVDATAEADEGDETSSVEMSDEEIARREKIPEPAPVPS